MSPATMPPLNLMDNAVCLVIRKGGLGVRRKVTTKRANEPGDVEQFAGAVLTDAEVDMIHATKAILESPLLAAVRTLDNQITKYLNGRTLPSWFKSGVFLLPNALIEDVIERLEAYAVERRAAVALFLQDYPAACARAAEKLKSVYDAADYPSTEKVGSLFRFEWDIVTVSVPETLKKLKAGLLQSERDKMAERMRSAAEDIQAALRLAMQEHIKALVGKLSPGADGRKKGLRQEALDQVNDFLATFAARNLTEDGELDGLVAQARDILDGVSVDDLKKHDDLRTTVLAAFQEVEATIDGMVQVQPRRALQLEDDDAAAETEPAAVDAEAPASEEAQPVAAAAE